MTTSRRKVLIAVAAVALVGGNALAWWWVGQRAERRHRDHEAALRQQAEQAAAHQRQIEEQREVDFLLLALRTSPDVRNETAKRIADAVQNNGPSSKMGLLGWRALIAGLSEPNVEVRRVAATTLRVYGKAAKDGVPDLVKASSDADHQVRAAAVYTLGWVGTESADVVVPTVTKALRDSKAEVREAAAEALQQFGPDAAPAVSTLVGAWIDDEVVRHRYSSAIRSIGAGAVQGLIPFLTHRLSEVRQLAAQLLEPLGPGAKDAVPALAKALDDPDYGVQGSASVALAKIGADAVPALIAALKHEKPAVRKLVIGSLSRSPAVVEAVPVIVGALVDTDVEVRRAAAHALTPEGSGLTHNPTMVLIQDQTKVLTDAVPALVKALADPDAVVRRDAATVLGRVGAKAEVAIPQLEKLLLTDPEAFVQERAAKALGSVGPVAAPALVKALADPNNRARASVVEALKKVGPAAKEVVPALVKAVSDPHIGAKAAEALGWFEPNEVSVSALVKALTATDVTIRRTAAASLYRFGWKSESKPQPSLMRVVPPPPALTGAVPALTKAVTDEDVSVRRLAVCAIENIGPGAKSALPALAKAVTDPDFHVRAGALDALGAIGADAAAAVPDIINALDDPDVRERAVIVLGRIGPWAKEAVPALERVRNTGGGFLPLYATRALEAIRKPE
ncbi:MAG: hypothetical protein C0501_02860 [Isosphaera sp.]|nr:hypothetical protein [Isosphaera sp.]